MTTADPGAIGVEIRQARKAHGWTQAELAERAHVSERTVRNFEVGGGGQPGTLGLILAALDRSPDAHPAFPEDVAFIVNAIGYRLLALPPSRRARLAGKLTATMMEDAADSAPVNGNNQPD